MCKVVLTSLNTTFYFDKPNMIALNFSTVNLYLLSIISLNLSNHWNQWLVYNWTVRKTENPFRRVKLYKDNLILTNNISILYLSISQYMFPILRHKSHV